MSSSIFSLCHDLYCGDRTVTGSLLSWAVSSGRRMFIGNPVCRVPLSVRFEHLFLVGRSGCGKSSFFHELMCRDLEHCGRRSRSLIYIDPVDGIDRFVCSTGISRWRNVFLIDPSCPESLPRLNMFETGLRRDDLLATAHMSNTFFSVCSGIIGQGLTPLMKTLLGYCSRVMVLTPDRTLEDLLSLLSDPVGHMDRIGMSSDDRVYRFFADNVSVSGGRGRGGFTETAKFVMNRVHGFLNDPIIERLLVNREPTLSLSKVIESGSVLLVATRKGSLGEDGARLIGKYIKSIVNRLIQERSSSGFGVPVFYYEDEFQTSLCDGTDECLETMLDENRKFGLSVNLATTRMGRLSRSMSDAVLSCGTRVCGSMQGSGGSLAAGSIGCCGRDLSDLPRHRLLVKTGTGGGPAVLVRTKRDPFRGFRGDAGGMDRLRSSMCRRFGDDYVRRRLSSGFDSVDGSGSDGLIVDVEV